ncbi:MAG TPA: TonB family protein [Acetobacteraceae bacterium]|nr:TonB family protein [Acetobacteraceae bacterium]
MWIDELQEEEEPRGWQRTAGRIGVGLLAFGTVGALIYSLAHQQANVAMHRVTTITRVLLPPPPPPTPPKPEKVEEQPKLAAPKPIEKAQVKPQQKPVQAPPASPLTAEAGTGPNPYGLQVGNGSGDVIGGAGGGGGSEGWQLYAGTIRSQVQGVLRQDDKTRFGRWQVAVKIWLSATGTVIRADIVNSSGDPAVDSAIRRDLDGLGVGQAPPQGMPQPVHLRIAAEPG